MATPLGIGRVYKGATYYHCASFTEEQMEALHTAPRQTKWCVCGKEMAVSCVPGGNPFWKCGCGLTREFIVPRKRK